MFTNKRVAANHTYSEFNTFDKVKEKLLSQFQTGTPDFIKVMFVYCTDFFRDERPSFETVNTNILFFKCIYRFGVKIKI